MNGISGGLTAPREQFICVRRHDEIVHVKSLDGMRPPMDVLVARIPKHLVWRRTVNLVMDGNHKTQSLSPVD